ncbi:heparinase II/III family protein [Pseudomonas chlororaphis]|uniref:alginate lyase family protein n=1 Tax=Pseudomonas chlororaphis TaxID=587753 RepID=UPI00209B5D14|nr:alginate lyase family protein [Pseudomonas chlororaphis]MCO7570127.1 heparinase II/III family protein [Pseudomonas chlororaphis]MCO7587274.1 heparinase II/III family protein [Pseudomonas chlororaphis]MCO7610372.1 heparinase II/III family protein [Pseudomonas chlororaphis]
MSWQSRIRRLLRHPPAEVARRLKAYALRNWAQIRLQARDRFLPTFGGDVPEQPLQALLPPITGHMLEPWRAALAADSKRLLEHRFDLLGAWDVQPAAGFCAAGLEGHYYDMPAVAGGNLANQRHAKRLQRLISPGYQTIDWHLDLRSGYRWPRVTPSALIRYGNVPGVDIKIPWELARMQHAPRLALAAAAYRLSGDQAASERLRLEFQDQVLDFIAANPPRFGVNWSCTMDVGIRIANLLLAYDIFIASGMGFATDFDIEFKRSVLAHGRHIVTHLEWFPHLRSNHYLANLAGLLFVAAYLPASAESDAWLMLAANELGKEMFMQFQADGSNFEASTSYHRLSAELVLFPVMLARRMAVRLQTLDPAILDSGLDASGPGVLPAQRCVLAAHALQSDEALRQLVKMADFSRGITRPDGGVAQVGDNDSGRFFKLTPDAAHDAPWVDGQAVFIDCVAQLRQGPKLPPASLDALLVQTLAGNLGQGQGGEPEAELGALCAFDDFGLYVYRRPRLWLSLRCGSVGQLGNGGHAHNDQLSLEVCFDGVPFILDPGTYVYTALPEQRNAFRSNRAHATLSAEPGEQNGWLAGVTGLFSLSRVAPTRVIQATEAGFVGEHDGFTATHRRSVVFLDDGFEVVDEHSAGAGELAFPLAPQVRVQRDGQGWLLAADGRQVRLEISAGQAAVEKGAYSPGYGCKVETQVIRVRNVPVRCVWNMRLLEPVHG